MKKNIFILLLAIFALSACSGKVNNDNKQNQDLPQSQALLEVLEEPFNYEDDTIHTVNWEHALRLIKNGAAVNQKDSVLAHVITSPIPNDKKDMALQDASARALVVDELLNQGAKGDGVVDEEGNTSLIYASSIGYFPVVEVLLKHNADINAINNLGNTALLVAVQPHIKYNSGFEAGGVFSYEGHVKIVEALLKAGAKTDIRNKKGESALMKAQEEVSPIDTGIPHGLILVNKAESETVRPQIIKLLKTAGAK